MRRNVIKIAVVVMLFTGMSGPVVADTPSFVAKLFGWLRSSIAVFSPERQESKDVDQRVDRAERRIDAEGSRLLSPKAPVFIQTVKLLRFYNYPNPFVPDLGTDFICELAGEATLDLKIFDLKGSMVKNLGWSSSESPPHWDGEDTIGRTVRTGMYIYSLKVTDKATGEVAETRYGKMMAWYMD